ncbi:P-loop containing nucleoside triphosphate hydrolase protein [Rozella allomycis CSF55]|uniref:RNA helicase n=1 Tax=Rozella allomycis (strain CSF55) TaxID=988480 RepID=A0A075AY91_ROZAC|nr:DNA/RNA helicase, DEAD/DEAH box type domain-containing protein [Rozella allomycis CSF55]RKP19999.1 P-loop containing nucleoside triphosphate hydrolase protein [Rozella allomycis CSF55]|eukprot:EPZ35242.1 DNA/RNA helicase, DEAD/DEAH box type domain-containing protein [Rozella allomycis CSF55]
MKEPVSLEELLKKKEEEERLNAKPKYMSKEERMKRALEERRRDAEKKRNNLEAFKTQNEQSKLPEPSPTYVKNTIPEKELQAIKAKYLGLETKNKRRRYSDRRFVFEWAEHEDTSVESNPLYATRKDYTSFGRGHTGGIDPNESSANKDEFYEKLMDERRTDVEKERVKELDDIKKMKEKKRLRFDDRHWTEKPLEEMNSRDWRILKEDYSISTKGGSISNPLRNWDEAELNYKIKRKIYDLGYEEPTPVQRQSIPIILSTRDMIGIAETGSGKTLAFLLPMIESIINIRKEDNDSFNNGPFALVLAPTRELALQIEQEAKMFTEALNLKTVAVVGGHIMAEQSYNLRGGVDLLIATPGRLKDLLESHVVVLNHCYFVVMDEADRMIDMGFEIDVNFILDNLPASTQKPEDKAEDLKFLKNKRFRQTTMFSATMPPSVERMAKKYLKKPAVVTIGIAGKAVDRIEQKVEMMKEDRKWDRLVRILNGGFEPPIIVFVRQKRTVDYLTRQLEKLNFKVVGLHGGKTQDQREKSLDLLRKGQKNILIATDVASRGIDIKDVSLVINYDMSKTIEGNFYSIGRTGRAGKEGKAITFLTNDDQETFYDLKLMLQASPISQVPSELKNHEAARYRPGITVIKKKSEETIFKDE